MTINKITSFIPSKAIALFTRQLSAMLGAGLPLSKALATLVRQTENKNLKKALEKIGGQVAGGKSFAEALKGHGSFSSLYFNMVSVGEASGALDNILQKLAIYFEKQERIKRKVVTAMTYPAIILLVSIGVIFALLTFVIPTFTEMFSDFEKDLPAATQIVITLSDFLKENVLLIVVGGFGSVFLAGWAFTQPGFKSVFDKALLETPLVGSFVKKASISRFASTLGALLNAGLPLVDAMKITAGTAGNRVVERAILDSLANITAGKAISKPLEETRILPPMVTQMVSVGEETGQLAEMLTKISEFYNDEVDAAVERLTNVMEPLMILGLGIVVAGLLIAMYLPMFEMIGNVQ